MNCAIDGKCSINIENRMQQCNTSSLRNIYSDCHCFFFSLRCISLSTAYIRYLYRCKVFYKAEAMDIVYAYVFLAQEEENRSVSRSARTRGDSCYSRVLKTEMCVLGMLVML